MEGLLSQEASYGAPWIRDPTVFAMTLAHLNTELSAPTPLLEAIVQPLAHAAAGRMRKQFADFGPGAAQYIARQVVHCLNNV